MERTGQGLERSPEHRGGSRLHGSVNGAANVSQTLCTSVETGFATMIEDGRGNFKAEQTTGGTHPSLKWYQNDYTE